jgi:hypothetical protein
VKTNERLSVKKAGLLGVERMELSAAEERIY